MEAKESPKHRTLAGKILRIFFKTILIILLVVATVALLILTPPVQNFIRGKATAWLSNKLKTRVDIGKIYIGFPKSVVLEGIYVEDRKHDTLLAGNKVKVDISMLKLLNNEVEVNQVQLTGITAKIKRVLPDTAYNFQFIIDAFASADTTTKQNADTSSMAISVKDVELDKIRLVYDDAVTGNDVTVWLEHFDTEIDQFDLQNMRFNVPETNISGIRANIYQRKPLVTPEETIEDTTTVTPAPSLDFGFDKFNLSDIKVDYGNDVSAMYTKLDLGKFVLDADQIDLKKQEITLDQLQLDNTVAAIKLGKTQQAKVVEEDTTQEAAQQANSGWKVLVKNIRLNNNDLAFVNDNEPKLAKGIDYAHLDAKDVTLHADDFLFSPDSIAGKITKGELKEQSGFELQTFNTNFLYSSTGAYLRNLILKTPGTLIRRSLEISYPSMEAVQKDIGQMKLNIDVADSRVQIKDILTFVPTMAAQQAFSNPNSIIKLTGRITGSVDNMNIAKLQMSALNNTNVDVRGTIAGLPDAKKLRGALVIGNISTTRDDIKMLAPKGALPTNITLPKNISLKGNVAGNMQQAKGMLNLHTDLGSASVSGNIANATDSIRATYDATVKANNLQLGVIMQNDTMFGPVTATISAKGKGFDPKIAQANVNAVINSAMLNRYLYKDVKLVADMASQKANFKLNINDPNITIDLDGSADIAGSFPAVNMHAIIDSINTYPLHFTADTLMYKGVIAANFTSTNPDSLNGQLTVSKSVLAANNQRFPVDTISIDAGENAAGKFLKLSADIFNFELTGKYKLTQLGSVFQQSIDPYYSITDSVFKDTLQDYDFRFKGQLVNGPLLQIFMPTLERLEPVLMDGHFATGQDFQTNIDAPLVIMGANRIQKLKINAGTTRNVLRFRTTLEQFSAGQSMNIYATTLNADIADNKINFLLNLKDAGNKNKYRFGGLFEQPSSGIYALKINPDSLLLNYDKWVMAADNLVRLNKGDVNIRNFTITRQQQQLSINSESETANAPLNVKLAQFRINTLTAFAKQDSAFIDGIINGTATVNNIAVQPTFVSDLSITDLMFRTDTVGNLNLKVNNQTENVFAADITLTGKGNDVAITGTYNVKPQNQSAIDLALDIRRLQMTSVQSFSMGAMTKSSGFINGKFDIQGTFDKPDVNGQLNFNQTAFTPTMLGTAFRINNESIKVNNRGINFDSFTILDSLNNKLSLDGDALTTNFINYKLDLNLHANDFQALNSSKQNNQLFYGKFNFDTDLHISGTEVSPKIDGNLRVNDKTDFTIVMPQAQPGVQDREGIVRFVDMDSVRMDTTLNIAQAGDTLSQSDVRGMDVAVNIEVDKAAALTMIIDEANGDFLRMKGTAQLSGGIDPSGKTTLTGSYEIEEGAYQLSLNLLKRKFDIQKGSKITWLGEPTKANVSLTAVYVANTAPLSLVENQVSNVENINFYKQKLPFQVKLILGGELLKPEISFDIALPEEDNLNVDASVIEDVDIRLTQLKSQPSELNKQVFALLLLNRFVQENPFASSGEGGFNAGTVARQSVSKLLTEQLNNLAADLISGVDLNFDVASTEDYTTGSKANRTDLNVSLSKQLLNDRLKVTVGSNFELEGPQQTNQRSNNIAGNVALDYMLSKDGRYMLRAYRKNEFEGELEGYIIETGVNFILSFDYDHFHDLLRRKKVKKENKDQPVPDDSRKAGIENDPVTN